MRIGIDVGGTNLKAGLVDEEGRILTVCRTPVERFADGRDFARTLAELALKAAAQGGVRPGKLECVGIGIPGAVRKGQVLYTCNLPLRDVPLADWFRETLDVPVCLGNDADCAAVGEALCGAGRGIRNFLLVTLGTGIGAGLILDGKLHTGCGMAGEVGHMVTHLGGRLCSCGRRGCWEQYASATGLIRRTEEEMEAFPRSLLHTVAKENGAVDGRTVFQAAEKGDQPAVHLCREYVEELGCGIVNLINLLHPERVAIGGGVAAAPESLLLQPLREIVAKESYARHGGVIPAVVRAQMGNDAGIVGAALLDRAVRE